MTRLDNETRISPDGQRVVEVHSQGSGDNQQTTTVVRGTTLAEQVYASADDLLATMVKSIPDAVSGTIEVKSGKDGGEATIVFKLSTELASREDEAKAAKALADTDLGSMAPKGADAEMAARAKEQFKSERDLGESARLGGRGRERERTVTQAKAPDTAPRPSGPQTTSGTRSTAG